VYYVHRGGGPRTPEIHWHLVFDGATNSYKKPDKPDVLATLQEFILEWDEIEIEQQESHPFDFKDHIMAIEVNGKFVCTGSIFLHSGHRGSPQTCIKTIDILVPQREASYLATISLNMISPHGGDFDDSDTIFTDIFSVDGNRKDTTNGYGGAWDRHFRNKGHAWNQAISAYCGVIQEVIRFRLQITGDNNVGASFYVKEL
jgi:hypothetical protein